MLRTVFLIAAMTLMVSRMATAGDFRSSLELAQSCCLFRVGTTDEVLSVVEAAPMPDDVVPGNLGAEYARLEGRWRGQWEGTLDAYLVIRKIESTSGAESPDVTADYTWGANLIVRQPGKRQVKGKLVRGVLMFVLSKDTSMVFELDDRGLLAGTLYPGNIHKASRIIMMKR